MYRSRFLIWVFILSCVIGSKFIFNYFSEQKAKPTYTLYTDSKDISFISGLGNLPKRSKINLTDSIEDADILILEHTEEQEVNGFSKYENYIYTPIVLYIGNAINNSGVTVQDDIYYKNFYIVLTAFEKDCEYSEIGLNESLEGKIKIGIPSENSQFYTPIEELFYLTLNNGNPPDENEKKQLKDRVDSLLEKCIKFENIKNEITIRYNTNEDNMLFLGPESLYYKTGSRYIDFYDKVYLENTSALYYDIYIKDENKEEIYDRIINSNIPTETGHRMKKSDNLYKNKFYTPKNVKVN